MSGIAPYAAMLAIGASWGLTIPLTKIAVSSGHHPLGLIAWQTIIMSIVMSALIRARGGRFPLGRGTLWLFVVIALTGTLIPNAFGYRAAAELPAGIVAILIAMVPLFAFPMAVMLSLDRVSAVRIAGLALGALAVVLIVAPEASLPREGAAIFVLVGLVPAFFYGIEGNYLAWRGTRGLDAFQVLWGASILGAAVAVPLALASGTWISLRVPWGPAEYAIPGIGATHAAAYTGYVWLVGRAGAVFAAQTAYLVTAMGVLWSIMLLGERYSATVWLAFVLMMAGVALVQPRRPATRHSAA